MLRLRLLELGFHEIENDIIDTWGKKGDLGNIVIYIPAYKNDMIRYKLTIGSKKIEGEFTNDDFDKAMSIIKEQLRKKDYSR